MSPPYEYLTAKHGAPTPLGMRKMLPFARMTLFCVCVVIGALLPHATSFATPPIQSRSKFASLTRTESALRTAGRDGTHQFRSAALSSTSIQNDLRDEIEQAARRRANENLARGGEVGGTMGGAVLGGMLGGPFGALFGAQIGASLGAASRLDEARKDEMKRKGVTPDMLDQATEIGVALNQAVEGLRATQESVHTNQKLAKLLDQQEKTLHERAKIAIKSGDEEGARKLLLDRVSVKEKLLKVLKALTEERKRLGIMESNVEALETRGLEIESLLRRSVGAAALQNSADTVDIGLSLEREDPLLKKFRDLGM